MSFSSDALNLVKTAAKSAGKKRVQTASVWLPGDGQRRFKQKWPTAGTRHVETSDAGFLLASGKVGSKSETPSRLLAGDQVLLTLQTERRRWHHRESRRCTRR